MICFSFLKQFGVCCIGAKMELNELISDKGGKEEEVNLMVLGDESSCLEHLLRPYYNLKTGLDTKTVIQEFQTKGIDLELKKTKFNLNIRIPTTRFGRKNTHEIREDEYEKKMRNIDAIILYFYQNNSKTLHNVQNKYLQETRTWFPKVPIFLLSLRIDENVNNMKQPLRETISVSDRFLKRDLDVSYEDGKAVCKKIKAKEFFEIKILKQTHDEDKEELQFDYDLVNCSNISETFEKVSTYVLKNKKKKDKCFCLCCFCCCRRCCGK